MTTIADRAGTTSWAPQLPQAWGVQRAKFMFARLQIPPNEDDGTITAFRDGQVTLRENRRAEGFTFATKEIGYQGVRKGDLVIHSMDGFAGAVGVSESTGKCSPVYVVCEPNLDTEPRFYAYILRHMAASSYITSLAKGIRERSTAFGWGEFKEQWLPKPSLALQQAIANYLDEKTATIDALIEKKRKLLDLLAEERAALINQAVTKGLDPSVPMKDSGIPWIGEIPAHWDLSPFKLNVAFQEGPGILAKDFHDVGTPLLRISCVREDPPTLDGCNFVDPALANTKWRHFQVQPRDLIISGSASTDVIVEVPEGSPVVGAICYTGLMRMRPRDSDVLGRPYLKLWLSSTPFLEQVNLARTGATIQHFGPTHLSDMVIVLPPLHEQERLLNLLHVRLRDAQALKSKILGQTDRLQEYRQALITAVVTGQLDIEAAA